MENFFYHFKILLFTLFILTLSHTSLQCSGFHGIGYTYPVGDIMIEYNTSTPLEITCIIMNETLIKENPNISSKLYFKKGDIIIPPDKIIVLNETSIKLFDPDLKQMTSFYTCMLEDTTICLNNVCVGVKPQPVTDFKCIGNNFENMTCSWTPPTNYVPTNYSLSYTFPKTRPGKRMSNCTITEDRETGKLKCFWGTNTIPHYRQSQDLYNFTVRIANVFGSLDQTFLFDHIKNILPEPPENLTCINSTTSSLHLSWKIPVAIAPISVGLQNRILYQCNFGPKIWQNGGLLETKPSQTNVTFNLTGLKHAHDVCDVRIAIRVKGAETEKMWSANSSLTAYTSSTIPGGPPKVNVGSFQTDITSNLRHVYVYWQQIPMEIRNGENLQYIVDVKDRNFENKLSYITSSYAKFSNVSLNESYVFTIRSKNSEGFSKESTTISVPANDKLIGEPALFTKVAFENGLYKLSWEKPKIGGEYIDNYTLFWCSYERDRPFQCAGYLNWTEVPANTTEYNITISEENTTQFAISANNATSSSGMVWATCTLIHDKVITKIKEVWIANVGPTFIEVKWKLDCSDRSDTVAGYIIYYCQITKELACQTQHNVTITDPYAGTGVVNGLTPYTTYMLTVSVINKQGSQSPESDKLYNTTYEAAPDVPYDLKVIQITNSSITISWKPPKKLNGYLRKYDIFVNKTMMSTPDNRTTFTVEYLQDDTIYNVSVTACTLFCSPKSIPILAKTETGHPGRVVNIWKTRENGILVLRWAEPNGRRKHNLYEMELWYNSAGENITVPTVQTLNANYLLANCEQDFKTYYGRIRAVNNHTNYTGQWSPDFEASCEQKNDFPYIVWIIVVTALAFLIFVMVIGARKIYIYYNDMKTIDVKLPPGLDPQIGTNWPQPNSNLSPSDEEHLLHKTFIANCGDSSGCSSGQESVASDCTSTITNTSDSGTEQPRTPTYEEPKELLMSIDSLKSNTQPYVQFPWNNDSVNINGYSLYGGNNTDTSEIELENVQTSKSTVDLPYTTCDQISHLEPRSNDSYVPLSNAQDKNPPYVMAANKSAVMSNFFSQNPSAMGNSDEKAYVQMANVNEVVKNDNDTVESPCDQ
ncbi:Fibronectin domain-containing protein [Oryctes borbonicus]|uniref:Fibronectin domain-containing protein n=1 Tax=Oryctes borbonicus TaxID=1629725 RepID=A0A0T6B8B1_9SCAR|nr:Fibronectin domain-containing protein [Oryctes borbonicus]